MFASKTIAEHLARGVVGIGAFAFAALWATVHPWLSLVAIPVALVALRGCPLCWMLGFVQTVLAKLQGQPTEGICMDGCRPDPARTPHTDRSQRAGLVK